jgi:glycosyltransferase involved in cell wall biosynthesis
MLRTAIAERPRLAIAGSEYTQGRLVAHFASLGERVLHPSLGEKLGLPPLDPMARGITVARASGSALDESVGGAALRVVPGEEEGRTEALLQLAEEKGARNRLITLGRKRAARFDWPQIAAAYVDAYRDALA